MFITRWRSGALALSVTQWQAYSPPLYPSVPPQAKPRASAAHDGDMATMRALAAAKDLGVDEPVMMRGRGGAPTAQYTVH